ncbi:MAG: hypothetical protein K6T17_06490 [Fimbriimonadales bacterium]|nr:hypothetical protein [Fimbriimonadales bacterium]
MRKSRRFLLFIAGILFIFQGWHSQQILFPEWYRLYSTHNISFRAGLTVDQLLASLAGFRQMVAGILWVRSDQYFHAGQFDAILPLIRLVTWLDPRQKEVYATGAWHIAYNFTDEQSRSDRRYIPMALALLKEGVEHNPSSYRLFHETGWIYYHKIEDDFDKATYWFEQSVQKPDVLSGLKGMLASAYLREARLDDAARWLWVLQNEAQARFGATMDELDRIEQDTRERRLDILLMRMSSRGIFGRRAGVYDKFPYDTHNPVDLNFSVKISVIDRKVLRVTGNWGIPTTGARIRMVLRDADYELKWEPAPEGLDFDVDRDRTYMQESLYTLNQYFDRKIDLSRNPPMYPLKAKDYIVEFYFSPRLAPHHIQDKIGWDGEGMTDKHYIQFEEKTGARVLRATFRLTRDMLLLQGKYADGAVIVSPGYTEPKTKDVEGVVIERSLRG